MAVVDNDTARNAVVTPSGARVSVIKLPESPLSGTDDEELMDCFVPVVVGDVGDRLPELAGFEKASFVVCAIPPTADREPSHVVLHHLADLARRRKKYVPAILVTYSSDIAPHLVSIIVDHRLPAHYILPEHLEGLSAADVAHAAFEKLREPVNVTTVTRNVQSVQTPSMRCAADTGVRAKKMRPRLIVCGREDRARQVIDGFLKHLTTDAMRDLSPIDDPTVILMTGRPGILQPSLSCSTHLARWLDRQGLARSGLCFAERSISRLVTRHTTDERTVFADDQTIFVPVVAEPADSEDLWLTVLATIAPDIIVFSDPDGDTELSAIRAAITAINRRATDTPRRLKLPILVVSGESGRREVTRQFENVLVYYSSLWNPDEAERFPAQGLAVGSTSRGRYKGDFLVDVIGDPVERMIGLFRAYDV